MDQPTAVSAPVVTAQGRYEELQMSRSPALMRAREAASLTIPALMPPEGTSDASTLPTPYQSVGARGVNNLAAKLLLALFPPSASFFRLKVQDFLVDQIAGAAAAGDSPLAEIESALAKVERAVITKLEQQSARPVLNEVLKHLPVCGNALLQILPKGQLKMFALDKYVVKRDVEGNPTEIIVREGLSRKTLPPAVAQIVQSQSGDDTHEKDVQTIWLYTWVRLDGNTWRVHQEVLGIAVPGTTGSYPKDKAAWLPLRWTVVSGSDYGRGHVEEYIGDLNSLEYMSQAVVQFAANASKIIWLVDEGGVTSKKTLQEAPNGGIVDGLRKDVEVLTMDKFPDFQVVKIAADEITHRLEQAFLLNSSIQRNAERVTAEEVRFMAGELEQALGGTYSVLGHELQRPLVVRLMLIMQRAKELPQLPEKLVSPQIITGLDGLGRSSDLMRLDLFLQGTVQSLGPEAVAEYVNAGEYMKRRAAALSFDAEGLVRSEQEVQQERQRQAQQALMEKLGPPSIKAAADQASPQPPAQPTQ